MMYDPDLLQKLASAGTPEEVEAALAESGHELSPVAPGEGDAMDAPPELPAEEPDAGPPMDLEAKIGAAADKAMNKSKPKPPSKDDEDGGYDGG